MYSQFLESKQDYQTHLEDWRERQKIHRFAAGAPSQRRRIRTWLVYPADWLIRLGLHLKHYATRESGLATSEMINGLGF